MQAVASAFPTRELYVLVGQDTGGDPAGQKSPMLQLVKPCPEGTLVSPAEQFEHMLALVRREEAGPKRPAGHRVHRGTPVGA